MPYLSIYLDGEGMLKGTPLSQIIESKEAIKIGALSHGMVSGNPSVSFAITLPDGRVVFGQTSMRLFHAAARAFAAKYGWQDGDEGQSRG